MTSPMRTFDPVRVGGLECDAWVAYYLRARPRFLRAAVGMVGEGFGMSRLRTVRGAWLVLRANKLWAPYPGNDPDGARAAMRRFYALVARAHGETFDVDEAARLEVEWWRVADGSDPGSALVSMERDALVRSYMALRAAVGP